jgi:hypothetical protein
MITTLSTAGLAVEVDALLAGLGVARQRYTGGTLTARSPISVGGRSSGGKASSPTSRASQVPEAMKLPSFGTSTGNRFRSLAGSGMARNTSLAGCSVFHRNIVVYALIYSFGLFYIYRILRQGPTEAPGQDNITPSRPMAVAMRATAASEE